MTNLQGQAAPRRRHPCISSRNRLTGTQFSGWPVNQKNMSAGAFD